CNEKNGLGSGPRSCAGCQTGFHTYTMIVDRSSSPEQIRWFLDGSQVFSVSSNQMDATTWANAVDHSFFIILDLAIGGAFPNGVCNCTSPTSATASGASLNVDYVRVFTSSGVASTPTATATPARTPTSTPTLTPTSTTGTGGTACSVHYAITNQWAGGFGASVTITNTGSAAINGWTLTWTFANGQTITQLWNGSFTQSGTNVSVTNLSYNGTIAPGSNTNFGFNGSWNGTNASPPAFALNGKACSVA
ncbi:MAG TPA: cellulose binding domain-containing protein, partial [Ktedonobacteraceae bacterium]|nr:cellulose binding domain-containing protein [Ktedonobacteraceae bacterium]